MTNSLINQSGKSYNAGYAVADAICNGAAATADVASKTAALAAGTTAVVVLGTAVVTTAAAGATYRGAKNTVHETAEVTTSFWAGFGRAFKDRSAARKAAKSAAADELQYNCTLVSNVVPIKPRVRVVNGQMFEVTE